jgi:hypothetical protein
VIASKRFAVSSWPRRVAIGLSELLVGRYNYAAWGLTISGQSSIGLLSEHRWRPTIGVRGVSGGAVPDDDRFPKEYGKGWQRAFGHVMGSPGPPDASASSSAPSSDDRYADLERALRNTLDDLALPIAGLDFDRTASEAQRIARLLHKTDPAHIDLCGVFARPDDDETIRLLGLVARMIVATMHGDLVAMTTNEVTLLLARGFLRALARRAGFDRAVPFRIGKHRSVIGALGAINGMLGTPSLDYLASDLIDRARGVPPTQDGDHGAA